MAYSFVLNFERIAQDQNGQWQARFSMTSTSDVHGVITPTKNADGKTPDDFLVVSLYLLKMGDLNETNKDAFAKAQEVVDKNSGAKTQQQAEIATHKKTPKRTGGHITEAMRFEP